jgi:catalase
MPSRWRCDTDQGWGALARVTEGERMVGLFAQCDPDYATRVADGLGTPSPVAAVGAR